ncbi:unnamed protein product [Prorocentrum cordatum]|uniref:RING-type domain-containing protein n=1 Tax=Prorocentrum cordatum TaxID=2364126 RepID=A0ABN9W5I8_9DINO|nr:unnamed protein product [Polarella glacialis]
MPLGARRSVIFSLCACTSALPVLLAFRGYWWLDAVLGQPVCSTGPARSSTCFARLQLRGPWIQLSTPLDKFSFLGFPVFRDARSSTPPDFLESMLKSELMGPAVIRFLYNVGGDDSFAPNLEPFALEVPQLPLFPFDCAQFPDSCRRSNIARDCFVLYPGHGGRGVKLAGNFDDPRQYSNSLRMAFAKIFPGAVPGASDQEFEDELVALHVHMWWNRSEVPLDWYLLVALFKHDVNFRASSVSGPAAFEVKAARKEGNVVAMHQDITNTSLAALREAIGQFVKDPGGHASEALHLGMVQGSVLSLGLTTLLVLLVSVSSMAAGSIFLQAPHVKTNADDKLMVENCSVCLAPFVNPVTLTCGHSLCRVCFKRAWLPQAADWVAPKCHCGRHLQMEVPAVNFALQCLHEAALGERFKTLVEEAAHEEKNLDELLSCPDGYQRGSKVMSRVDASQRDKSIRRGDEGIVLGPAPGLAAIHSRCVVCCFPPDDKVLTLASNELCKAFPEGLRIGQRCKSLTAEHNWKPRPLKIGDEGKILGPAPPPHEVRVNFGGDPPLQGNMYFNQICKSEEFDERLGGFHVGQVCKSLVAYPDWQPRPLNLFDEGKIVGPAPPPHEVKVDFGGDPPLQGKLYLNQICKAEEFDERLGGFHVGQSCKSLVAYPDWQPRPLNLFEEGRIVGPAPPPHEVRVNFGGDPPLEGKLYRRYRGRLWGEGPCRRGRCCLECRACACAGCARRARHMARVFRVAVASKWAVHS